MSLEARRAQSVLSHETVLAEVKALFDSPSYRPPTMPAVAMELLSMTESGDLEPPKAAEVLGRDPVLAAQVVKRARSAAYSGRTPVATLKEAVVRLGVMGTRDVALECAMAMTCFSSVRHANLRENLRRHAVAVAHLSRGAALVAGASPEESFLCGLLHDLGSVGTLLAIEELSKSWRMPIDVGEVWSHLDALHPEQSAAIARFWGMPDRIIDVLDHHHDLALQGPPRTIASTVVVGEGLAERLGHAIRVSDTQPEHVRSVSDTLMKNAQELLMLEGDPTKTIVKHIGPRLEAALGVVDVG